MIDAEDSSTVNQFLEFLQRDIELRAGAVQLILPEVHARIELLTTGIEVDPSKRIFGHVHL